MDELRVILSGASGAMGRAVAALAPSRGVKVIAGVDKQEATNNSFPIYSSFSSVTEEAGAVIDFSHYSMQPSLVEFCLSKKLCLVSATTGLSEEDESMLLSASASIPILRSKNFSYGISVFKRVVELAASMLRDSFDVELIEAHHNKKKDSPSGTAQQLAEAVSKGSQKAYDYQYGRVGGDALRKPEEMGIHSIRGGSIVGMHEIVFAGDGEMITLKHEALSKDVFASGALKGVWFLASQKPGFYTFDDIAAVNAEK